MDPFLFVGFVWTAPFFAAEWSQECHKARRGKVQTWEAQLFPVATSRHHINGAAESCQLGSYVTLSVWDMWHVFQLRKLRYIAFSEGNDTDEDHSNWHLLASVFYCTKKRVKFSISSLFPQANWPFYEPRQFVIQTLSGEFTAGRPGFQRISGIWRKPQAANKKKQPTKEWKVGKNEEFDFKGCKVIWKGAAPRP